MNNKGTRKVPKAYRRIESMVPLKGVHERQWGLFAEWIQFLKTHSLYILLTIKRKFQRLVSKSKNRKKIKKSKKLAKSQLIQSPKSANFSGDFRVFSILAILLDNFFHFFAIFLRKIKGLRQQNHGYVMILIAIAIPILLMGVKFSQDQQKQREIELERNNGKFYKKCAREAALAVAQNWNPGLTLSQQKDGIYKVADAVYNAHPVFHDSPVGDAIPGLDIKNNYQIDKNSKLMEMNVSNKSESVTKIVRYTTATKYIGRFYNYANTGSYVGNRWYIQWLSTDKVSDPENRMSKYDEIDQTQLDSAKYILIPQDIYVKSWPRYSYMYSGYPTDTKFDNYYTYHYYTIPCTSLKTSGLGNYLASDKVGTLSTNYNTSVSTSTYTVRSTGTDSSYVKIAVENDKLKVQTDNDIATAVPAQCNVDIVLAIPTNGAASNANNRDAASDTAGTPYI